MKKSDFNTITLGTMLNGFVSLTEYRDENNTFIKHELIINTPEKKIRLEFNSKQNLMSFRYGNTTNKIANPTGKGSMLGYINKDVLRIIGEHSSEFNDFLKKYA